MLSSLVNKPNRVYEMQRRVQASHEPIYYRLPRSNLYMKSYYLAFSAGVAGIVYGTYSLVAGKK